MNPGPPAKAPTTFIARIDACAAQALHAGALAPIASEMYPEHSGGWPLCVRQIAALAAKPPGEAAGARRNPFLPPDPALTVCALGEDHLLILNKFPVLPRHVLIVPRHFVAQSAPLAGADFAAAAALLAEGGLLFYNGDRRAGASQPHQHLQWLAGHWHDPGFMPLLPWLATTDRRLPFRHAQVRLPGAAAFAGATPTVRGHWLAQAQAQASHQLGFACTAPALPYNLLISPDWLLIVPRRQESVAGLSINALGFAGSLVVDSQPARERLLAHGPMRALIEAGLPAA